MAADANDPGGPPDPAASPVHAACGVCGRHVAQSLLRIHEQKCARQRAARKLIPDKTTDTTAPSTAEGTHASPQQHADGSASSPRHAHVLRAAQLNSTTSGRCDVCGKSFSARLMALHQKKCAQAHPGQQEDGSQQLAKPAPPPQGGYGGPPASPPLSPSPKAGGRQKPRVRPGPRVAQSQTSLPSVPPATGGGAQTSRRPSPVPARGGRQEVHAKAVGGGSQPQRRRMTTALSRRTVPSDDEGAEGANTTPTSPTTDSVPPELPEELPARYTSGSPIPHSHTTRNRPRSSRLRRHGDGGTGAAGKASLKHARVIWEAKQGGGSGAGQQGAPPVEARRTGRADQRDPSGSQGARVARRDQLDVLLECLSKPVTPDSLSRREASGVTPRGQTPPPLPEPSAGAADPKQTSEKLVRAVAQSSPTKHLYSQGGPIVFRPIKPIAGSRVPLLNLYAAVPTRKATLHDTAPTRIPLHAFRRTAGL